MIVFVIYFHRVVDPKQDRALAFAFAFILYSIIGTYYVGCRTCCIPISISDTDRFLYRKKKIIENEYLKYELPKY